jgi:Protein of unknown function (DUF3485)
MANREKIRPNNHQLNRWFLAVVLLGMLTITKLILFRTPAQAEAYFQRIVALSESNPAHFGSWVSMDAPIPEAAITMLRPNVTISRKYTNVATGEEATLLLVQCRDAHDLFGHYPPVCYAAHGFRNVDSVARDWDVDGLTVHGMVYTFSSTRPEQLTSMIIYDFMILPNRTTCRDMEGVYASARDPRARTLGAAQLQILLSATMPEEERDALFLSLVQSNRPILDAILDGSKKS